MPKVRKMPKMKRPRPHLVNRAPSVMTRLPTMVSLLLIDRRRRSPAGLSLALAAGAHGARLLDVAGLPALVDRRLGRAVEPKNREEALARDGAHPVALLAGGCCRAQVEIGRAVGILLGLVA